MIGTFKFDLRKKIKHRQDSELNVQHQGMFATGDSLPGAIA
jgi:hypothetical protein